MRQRWWGVLGGIVVSCLAGCADAPEASSSSLPSGVPLETASASSAIAGTTASPTGASLSASEPAPSAPTPLSSSARAAEIEDQLMQLEAGSLRSLNGGALAFKIGGKSAKELTAADLDAALGRAGCTASRLDSPSQAGSAALFDTKCASHAFTVTFVPAGVPLPSAQTIADMDRNGATWSESGMLLAIMPKEKGGRAAAFELLGKLRGGAKGQAAVSGGSVANAGEVVAGMAPGFRRCYNRGLQDDPKLAGTVRITAKLGPNGEVLSASPTGGSGLPTTVTSCVAGVVSSRQFAPPEGGGATIVIPVSFQAAQ